MCLLDLSKAPTWNQWETGYNYNCIVILTSKTPLFIFISFSFVLLVSLLANLKSIYDNIASFCDLFITFSHLLLYSDRLKLVYFDFFLYVYIRYFYSEHSFLILHSPWATFYSSEQGNKWRAVLSCWPKTDFSRDLLTNNHRSPEVMWWWTSPLDA